MPSLRVQIVRFVDEYQPGIVECQFRDALGEVHRMIDKLPIFTDANLWSDSDYPQPGLAECMVLERMLDSGRNLARIRSLETTEGKSEFVVSEADLSD
jgi:hypothetical protein